MGLCKTQAAHQHNVPGAAVRTARAGFEPRVRNPVYCGQDGQLACGGKIPPGSRGSASPPPATYLLPLPGTGPMPQTDSLVRRKNGLKSPQTSAGAAAGGAIRPCES